MADCATALATDLPTNNQLNRCVNNPLTRSIVGPIPVNSLCPDMATCNLPDLASSPDYPPPGPCVGAISPNTIMCNHQLSGKCENPPAPCDRDTVHNLTDGHATPASPTSTSPPLVYIPNPDLSGRLTVGNGAYNLSTPPTPPTPPTSPCVIGFKYHATITLTLSQPQILLTMRLTRLCLSSRRRVLTLIVCVFTL